MPLGSYKGDGRLNGSINSKLLKALYSFSKTNQGLF